MKTRFDEISNLLSKRKLTISDCERFLNLLGTSIDSLLDNENLDELKLAIRLGNEFLSRVTSSRSRVAGNYFVSVAWGGISSMTTTNTPNTWSWEHDDVEQQIIHLRLALNEQAFELVEKERQCQILTNLGNLLNQIGRSVEAIEYWEKSNGILHNIGMSQGNLAVGRVQYGNSLYEPHDAIQMLSAAHDGLRRALQMPGMHPAAEEYFADYLTMMDRNAPKFARKNHKFKQITSFGKTEAEAAYRKWALSKRLFLNHLVELGNEIPEAATDNITLPAIVRPIQERSLHFEGLLNQIKQEFVSARYLYFEGVHAKSVHFSDRLVTLYNTGDYPSYSIAVEKIKVAFRMGYSLFDKMAFFLNDYLDLNIDPRRVTFKTIWYEKGDRSRGLRSEFINRQNWSLRGLFWLSKDLYEDSASFRRSIEPDAQALADIRNHLEHKYLKVHEFGPPENEIKDDTLAYSVGRSEISDKALKVLKLARSAFIYLILAIRSGELNKEKSRSSTTKVSPLFMDVIDDSWKS